MKYLFLFFISTALFAQKKKNLDSLPALEKLIIYNYTPRPNHGYILTFYKKSSIPKVLKKALKKRYSNFRIANPGKKFRETDVVSNAHLPPRQLLFTVRNANYCSVVYRQGGRSLGTYFAFSEIIDNKVTLLHVYYLSGPTINTYDDFVNAIRQGNFSELSF
ncbi:hypothetical protein FMM05_06400 [Flavobacterium zepuense]|uniref:Uncharacterized protein n=1 Tax=Flavobacterium zepuense TaxID=2593302 RepID=A0A552V5W6_9FLAO|nr:hypothetical protein [Flavobacterium zepuense]TRW25848.1 hypothetical protein FMM05_06400 [Flavobacterium zepuense]